MSDLKSIDAALVMYQSARAELIERIRLRDQILLIYLAAAGALFAVGFGVTPRLEVLLALPFVAFGASVLASQHNALIGSLGRFCVAEIHSYLVLNGIDAPQWDDSHSLRAYKDSAIRLRSLGHIVILVVPCVVALAANYKHAIDSPFPYGPLWWASLLCASATVWLVYVTHNWRVRLYLTQSWRKDPAGKGM